MAKCLSKILLASLLVAIIFFIVSLVLAFKILPDILSDQIDEEVGLRKGTDQYDKFMELPFSTELKVYFFHVVNKEQIFANEKPIVKEVGPYVYRQYRHKTKLYADCDEDTITYTQNQILQFDASASDPLTEKDLVTVLNFPLMYLLMLAEADGRASFISGCLSELFPPKHDELFMEVSVEDLMLKGFKYCQYTDSITCNVVWTGYCPRIGTYRYAATEEDGIQFSYLNHKTASHDGVYTIKRGIEDVADLGRIVTWNNLVYTDYWGKNTSCSQINGTDPNLYPPGLEKDSSTLIFSTDICRSVELNFLRETTYEDIEGYDFGISAPAFWSTAEEEDDCFCTKLTHGVNNEDSCFLDGVLDFQSCTGAPFLLSFPHFLWADPKYTTSIDGMVADENLHRTRFVIEPNTGTLLEGLQRMQLNTVLRPIEGIEGFQQLPRVVMPLLWIEEKYALNSAGIDDLKSKYFNKVQMFEGIRWSLVALTTLLIVVFAAVLVRRKMLKT